MSKYSENIPQSILGAIGWFYDDIPQKSTVLDFGCSTGYYGEYIRKHKKSSVYGVEISDDRFKAEKVLDGVYSFDLDGEWPDEIYERKYDVIYFGDVIEHLREPGKTLEKTLKLLRPKGKVFISTPNIAHTSIRLELLGGNFEYESMGILDNTHLKYFTLHSLTNLVVNAGYQIDRIDYSLSDYPREVVQSLLNKYGLKASKDFWKMLEDPTARAFQHKLVLSRARGNTKQSSIPEPAKKPEQYKRDFINDIQTELHNFKVAYNAKEKELAATKEALSAIKSSKAYRLVRGIQKARKGVRVRK